MFYRVVRFFGRLLLDVFFRDITLKGEPLVKQGPLLIVANHPNYLFDPALLGSVFARPLWYLAKGTLFKNPLLSWFLKAVHMVPVYRRQDNPAEVSKNNASFAIAAKRLRANGAIAVFPEGVSLGERKLSTLKTGSARIALQAEAESDFQCGLLIQPLGITYADLKEFQTSVTVCAGVPIRVSDYRDVYEADPQNAVRLLTVAIDTALQKVTVEVPDDDMVEFVELLGKLYSGYGYAGDDRALLSEIVKNVHTHARRDGEEIPRLLLKLRWYVSLAAALQLDPGQSRREQPFLFLLCIAPFVFLGSLFHVLPYRYVGVFVRRMKREPVETATMKLIVGTLLFLLWYTLFALFLSLVAGTTTTALSLLVVITSGYFTLKWSHGLRAVLGNWLLPGRARARATFEQLGDELFAECEAIRLNKTADQVDVNT